MEFFHLQGIPGKVNIPTFKQKACCIALPGYL